MLATLAAFAAAAVWGHRTEWTFGFGHRAEPHRKSGRTSAGIASVRILPAPAKGTQSYRLAEIEFDSAEAVERAGIDVAAAWTAPMEEVISASGEIRFDPSRTARLSSRAAGTAWRVNKSVGDAVKAGEVLALIDAGEVGRAKAEFQHALVQQRLKATALEDAKRAGSALPEPQRREAEAAVRDAEVRLRSAEQALINLGLPVRASDYDGMPLTKVFQRMRLLGISDAESRGDGTATTGNLLPLRSPLDGVVLNADVVMGEVVDASKVLFAVVDPRRLWLTLHVSQADFLRVHVGQPVRFRPAGLGGEVTGKLSWVGTAADETTRTVPARAELANDDGRLRASTLGQGRITVREAKDAVVVPNDAIVTIQAVPIVFVRDPDFFKPQGPKRFFVQVVGARAKDAEKTEIDAGVKAGDVIATKGAGVLLGEYRRAAVASSERTDTNTKHESQR